MTKPSNNLLIFQNLFLSYVDNIATIWEDSFDDCAVHHFIPMGGPLAGNRPWELSAYMTSAVYHATTPQRFHIATDKQGLDGQMALLTDPAIGFQFVPFLCISFYIFIGEGSLPAAHSKIADWPSDHYSGKWGLPLMYPDRYLHTEYVISVGAGT